MVAKIDRLGPLGGYNRASSSRGDFQPAEAARSSQSRSAASRRRPHPSRPCQMSVATWSLRDRPVELAGRSPTSSPRRRSTAM